MARRRKILIFGLCGLAAIVAVCFFCLRENEPSYNRQTLSEWLDIYDPTIPGKVVNIKIATPQQRSAAEHAIVEIGTNALPLVLKWARGGDSWRRPWLYDNANSLPVLLRSPLQRFIWTRSAAHRSRHALMAVRILGTNAEPILAELNTRFRSSHDPSEIILLANMIGSVGPKGIQCLTGAITDCTGDQRRSAIGVIKRLARGDAEVRIVLQALLPIINDSRYAGTDHRTVRIAATNVIETIAPEVLTNKSKIE